MKSASAASPTHRDAPGALSATETVIPILAEEARIEKVQEHTGTVRLRKVVRRRAQPVEAGGWREVVDVVRTPVGRIVDLPAAPSHEHGRTVYPVYEERWVRQLVLVE